MKLAFAANSLEILPPESLHKPHL